MLTKAAFIARYWFSPWRNWIHLFQTVYSILGVCFLTLFPLYCKVFDQKESYFMSPAWFWYVIILGIVCFIVDGIWIHGYLLWSITIENKTFDGTKIIVEFGDIFKKDGLAVIAVNEFFDNAVSSRPKAQVAEKTLHGAMIKNFWENNPENWYSQITDSINDKPIATRDRKEPCQRNQYPIGSTAIAIAGKKKFLCVALSRTNISTLEAKASFDDLMIALRKSLVRAREACSNEPLNFPLMGSSLSRTGVSKYMLLNLLLMNIFEESKNGLITSTIRIVLPYSDFSNYNLKTIKKEWS